MKKLEITKINKYQYELKDDNRVYHFNMEFFNVQEEIKVGDFIYMSEKLLREENTLLSFDQLDSTYGRKIKDADDNDLIILVVDNKKIYLKRVYG